MHAPIDHADPTREDARTIDLQVSATDGQKTSSATLAIRIEDDAPLSGAQVVEVQGQAATQNTNLMLILDTSGSMKDRLADMTVNGLKAAIKTLIDRLDTMEPPDPRDGPHPPRHQAQRRAAALMRLVHGDTPPTTTIDIVIDHDTFAGRPPADPRDGRCELIGHGPIAPSLVRTAACDAAIGRVVMRGKSEILDLGRRTRDRKSVV